MSEHYSYIQTVRDIDESVNAYAIRPVSGSDEVGLSEENPILAFGPLGKINIFVGATNAGKSRFLRTLAKCTKYCFWAKDTHDKARQMLDLCEWFTQSSGVLTFKINQQGEYYTSGRPVAFGNMPQWIENVLKGLKARQDHDAIFDSEYFRQLQTHLRLFFAERLLGEQQQKALGDLGRPIQSQEALWAVN